MFCPPDRLGEPWAEALAAGRAKRPDDLGPLESAAVGTVAAGDDVKATLDLARPTFALYIGGMGAKGKNFYNDVVSQIGFAEEAEKIQDLYLAGNRRDAEALVPVELLEMCNLVGPESYLKERIAAFRDAGVTSLNVTPAAEDRVGLVAKLKEWVS